MSTLYDKDFFSWCEDQANRLKYRSLDLDFEHLQEELEEMAKKHIRELKNRLVVLISHFIKCEIQPELICNSWKSTIFHQKNEIKYLLEENPSMKKLLNGSILIPAHEKAYEIVSIETGFPQEDLKTFWFSWKDLEIKK